MGKRKRAKQAVAHERLREAVLAASRRMAEQRPEPVQAAGVAHCPDPRCAPEPDPVTGVIRSTILIGSRWVEWHPYAGTPGATVRAIEMYAYCTVCRTEYRLRLPTGSEDVASDPAARGHCAGLYKCCAAAGVPPGFGVACGCGCHAAAARPFREPGEKV